MKNLKGWMTGILMLGVVIMVVSPGWSAATLDDVARDIQQLQIAQARLEERISSEIGGLRTIMVTLFTALFAAMAGLFYFVLDISRSLRIPKEERVSKLETFMERIKEHIREIDEKLHLPKPIL